MAIIVGGFLFMIANIVVGPQIATMLIYHAGAAGCATVTASHATSIQYNDRDVRAHDVLIRTADGALVEARFEDDDFNVYPSHNRTFYPGGGDFFTVRYLRHAPSRFVIVANDGSPWARSLRCGDLESAMNDTAEKARFAPDDPAYRAAYGSARSAARAGGCGG